MLPAGGPAQGLLVFAWSLALRAPSAAAAPPVCDALQLSGAGARQEDRALLLGLLQQAPEGVRTEQTVGAVRRLVGLGQEGAAGAVQAAPDAALARRDGEALSQLGDLLLAAYRQTGHGDLLRSLLAVKDGALERDPRSPGRHIDAADVLFDLCRHHGEAPARRALELFEAAERIIGRSMCNAKVVLLMKQLGQRGRGEAYAQPCSLSYDRLHLQHPKVPTQPWWSGDDPRLPGWIRRLGSRRSTRVAREDLQRCLREAGQGFDDSYNDWFFVGERQRWTGLNLMHSQRGGWQEAQCAPGACAARLCQRLRGAGAGRRSLDFDLWHKLSETVLQARPGSPAPPLYVNIYALAPGAHIIPHLGNDARLTVHLALEVPPRNLSRIRVADEVVPYRRPGQLLVFDDAYEHEVWNDANTTRYVLGITIWHPELLARLPAEQLGGSRLPPTADDVRPAAGAGHLLRWRPPLSCAGRLRCGPAPAARTPVR